MRNSKQLLDFTTLIDRTCKMNKKHNETFILIFINSLYNFFLLYNKRKTLIRVRILRLENEKEILKNLIYKNTR